MALINQISKITFSISTSPFYPPSCYFFRVLSTQPQMTSRINQKFKAENTKPQPELAHTLPQTHQKKNSSSNPFFQTHDSPSSFIPRGPPPIQASVSQISTCPPTPPPTANWLYAHMLQLRLDDLPPRILRDYQ